MRLDTFQWLHIEPFQRLSRDVFGCLKKRVLEFCKNVFFFKDFLFQTWSKSSRWSHSVKNTTASGVSTIGLVCINGMFQGLLKVERSHSTICIFRRFHRLLRDVLRPSRFYRFQVWCLGNGWCFQMCWLENFCRWSYSSYSEDLALLILNQSWDIFALTPTRGLDEGNQILEFWRLRIDGFLRMVGRLGWWLVGLVEFLWPKKKPSQNDDWKPRCWCALFCGVGLLPWVRNPPGNFSKTFRSGYAWYAFQEPRFKEILGADGYDVGIPMAFPGSGVCSGMHDWTTSNDVEFLGPKRGGVPSTSWKAGWLWHLLATRGGKKSVETFQHCASERTPTFNCVIDEIPSIYTIISIHFHLCCWFNKHGFFPKFISLVIESTFRKLSFSRAQVFKAVWKPSEVFLTKLAVVLTSRIFEVGPCRALIYVPCLRFCLIPSGKLTWQ